MKSAKRRVIQYAVLTAALVVFSVRARAEGTTFAVDTNQSWLTISGTFSGIAFQPQGPGSLTTHYMGAIKADVSDTTITFIGGSTIIAMTNGNWQPLPGGAAGSAPANYGGQAVIIFVVNGKAAVRNLVLDLTSTALTLAGGTFPSQGLEFTFPTNASTAMDYNYTSSIAGSGSGSEPLTGTTTNTVSTNATLMVQGTNQVLTVPVNISGIAPGTNDLRYQLIGQIVAKAPVLVPLRIKSLEVSAGQLQFTVATTPGQTFTILGSTNLSEWPMVVDQFTATNNLTVRTVSLPATVPEQYFRVRQD